MNATIVSDWLYTNAPAAWISAVVAFVSFVVLLISRKKPKRLVVKDMSSLSMVRIRPKIKKRISLSFDGTVVKSLGQVELQIFNEGSEEIKQPSLTVELPKESKIINVEITPQESRREIIGCKTIISFDYINPFRDHKQIYNVSILADGEIDPVKISGSGEGWSTRHISFPTNKQMRRGLAFWAFGIIAFLIVGYFYFQYIEKTFGISKHEISLRSVLASLPLWITMAVVLKLFLNWADRAFRLTEPAEKIEEADQQDA